MKKVLFLSIIFQLYFMNVIYCEKYLDDKVKGSNGIYRWQSNNIHYRVHVDGAGDNNLNYNATSSLIQAAYNVWDNVTSANITFTQDGSVDGVQTGDDGINGHYWVYPPHSIFGGAFYDDPSTTEIEGASSYTIHQFENGVIVETDILYNGKKEWKGDNYLTWWNEVESVAIHEIGHCLGFDHATAGMTPIPVMTYSADPASDRHTLKLDDIKGISFLFGGNIVDNETFSGTNYFDWNISVASGKTLTFQSGTTVTFNNGSSLIVNSYGALVANGTSALPITFDFVSPNSTTENGIKFTSGSMGTISYCKIRNAYRGIYEGSTSIDITNSAFSNCRDGLYLYVSAPTVQYCNFHDNVNAGIYLVNSSPYLYKNNMRYNYYGVYSITNSTPHFGYSSTRGKNEIRDNYCGVYCWNNSLPELGKTSPLSGGYNNLVNTSQNITNQSSGTLYATHTWWGTTTPAYFKINGTGTTLSTEYLAADTIRSTPPLSKTTGNNDIPLLSELDKANELIADKNLEEAREVCLNLINNYPGYSVSYNALNLLKETYAKDDVENVKSIYETLFNLKEKKVIYATAGLILSDIDKENRLKHIEEVISKYEGESVIELALFDKFVYYNFETSDKENSRAVTKKLDELFPLSIGAIEAHRILGDKEYFDIYPEEQSIKKTVTTATPTEYALYDNYPNPFNPATTVNFQIPKDGYVILKVYDILGREVASLVNEERKAGRYSHNFDASKLSSGVYIYKMTANDFVQSKKMLLMK